MDTTVILAQPRVSRLRADAVYVDRRGSPGRTVDPGFASARFARRPPKNRPNLSHVYMIIRGKGAKKSRILTRDLAAQIAARSLPSIYDYCS